MFGILFKQLFNDVTENIRFKRRQKQIFDTYQVKDHLRNQLQKLINPKETITAMSTIGFEQYNNLIDSYIENIMAQGIDDMSYLYDLEKMKGRLSLSDLR